MPLGTPGQPPVEAGEIDEHADVGTGVEKAPLGTTGEVYELVEVEEHTEKPHHRQLRQVGNEAAALSRHARPTEPDTFDVGLPGPDRPHEHGGMMVARGFTRREKHTHGQKNSAPKGKPTSVRSIPSSRRTT